MAAVNKVRRIAAQASLDEGVPAAAPAAPAEAVPAPVPTVVADAAPSRGADDDDADGEGGDDKGEGDEGERGGRNRNRRRNRKERAERQAAQGVAGGESSGVVLAPELVEAAGARFADVPPARIVSGTARFGARPSSSVDGQEQT